MLMLFTRMAFSNTFLSFQMQQSSHFSLHNGVEGFITFLRPFPLCRQLFSFRLPGFYIFEFISLIFTFRATRPALFISILHFNSYFDLIDDIDFAQCPSKQHICRFYRPLFILLIYWLIFDWAWVWWVPFFS